MSLLKNAKKIMLLLVLCLIFTNTTKASSIEGFKKIADNEVEYSVTEYEMGIDILFMDCEDLDVIKNGEKWREFWNGILDGIGDSFGTPTNDNNGGLSSSDLKYLESYAKDKLGSRDKGFELVSQIELLIKNDSNIITEAQLLSVIKDRKVIEIFKRNAAGDNTFPLEKNARKRGFWGKLGYVIGRIIGHLILSYLP